MPRVLRIINRLNLGGPTYNAAYLTRYLAPEFETLLVAGMKDDTEESSEYIVEGMGIKPVFITDMRREIRPSSDLKAYKQIKKIIRDFKPDIVHTHAAKAGTLGRLAAYNCDVPVIVHTFHGHVFHSYFNPLKTALFKGIERGLSSISTGIIAISELQKQELCQQHKVCPESKVKVIPLGFDLDRFHATDPAIRDSFRNQFGIENDDIAIGIIGRIVHVKNHPMFIRAFKQVLSKHRGKVKAVIIGDGEDRQKIEQLCQDNTLRYSTPERPLKEFDVVFTSWIHNIESALAGCDIIAMTSYNEGTPVSLIEAQAASKPIVTTTVGGIANVVLPNQTALLSDSNDDDAMAANLIRLVESKETRDLFSKNGWPFVKERFHYQRLVDDMRSYYRFLLDAVK
ncbi:MAG: glycosyltransferase [Bacteroidota bacterium]|jgi:glycosyltransferase involved in cell wall biosynthesis